jgi:hypothetical protein
MRLGHGRKGHHPDWTWKRAPIALEMAAATFRKLREIAIAYSAQSGFVRESSEWSRIQGTVANFISYEPPLYRRFWFDDTVADYRGKVAALGPGYRLTERELVKRQDFYLKYLERIGELEIERARRFDRVSP